MTAPAKTRSQRMIDYVIGHPGASYRDIVGHLQLGLAKPQRDVVSRGAAAQLYQLLRNGKLRRTGTDKAYAYWPTKVSKLDLRRFDRTGRARVSQKHRPAPAPKAAKVRARKRSRHLRARPSLHRRSNSTKRAGGQ